MNDLQKNKRKIHLKRFNKFGFKNGISIKIELEWWAILIILVLVLVLIFKYIS